MAITLQRNPDEIQAWHLVDLAAMAEAAIALQAAGYRYTLSNNADGTPKIEVNSTDDKPPIIGQLGEWFVLDMGLRHIRDTHAGAAAGYHLIEVD